MTETKNPFKRLLFVALILLPASFMLLLSGCAALGLAANALPRYQKPTYIGMTGQSIGVMVWADQGVLIDWPTIQLDLANGIQKKLSESKAEELEGTTYPVKPASIVRYQRDHPGIELASINEVAPKFGVSRLIYIEIEDFRTRPELSMEMFRGSMLATIKVIEIENGQAKTGYEENGVRVLFPKKANEVGEPRIGDYRTYLGTLDECSTGVLNRFVKHDVEQ